ncbi:hypothetical protein ACFPFV_12470 [Salinicoccus siamensis]
MHQFMALKWLQTKSFARKTFGYMISILRLRPSVALYIERHIG